MISAKPFVFASYSRRDTELMRELVEQLEFFADEVDWFVDERDIRSGQVFEDVIDEALDRTTFAVLLVSPGLHGSDYIRDRELPALLDEGVALAWVTKIAGFEGGRIRVAASFERGVHKLRPFNKKVVAVTRKLDGEEMRWRYGPFKNKLRRLIVPPLDHPATQAAAEATAETAPSGE